MPTEKTKIMVVEDEPLIADDIQLQLETMDYEVPAVLDSGEEAVEAARRHRPDLILMDIELSGDMDGIQAAERIREQDPIPVVFLTAFGADDVLQRAKSAEPYGYLLKPFNVGELKTTIEVSLFKAGQENVHRQNNERRQRRLQRLAAEVTVNETRRRSRAARDIRRLMERSPWETGPPASDPTADWMADLLRISEELSPGVLAEQGLEAGLTELAEVIQRQYPVQIASRFSRYPPNWPEPLRDLLYLLVQEILIDLIRRFQPSQIELHTQRLDPEAGIVIIDNGDRPPAPAGASDWSESNYVCFSVRERLAVWGGRLDVFPPEAGRSRLVMVVPAG